MKKRFIGLLSLAIAPILVASLASCGNSNKIKIGVCQLVTHDALDAATQGFIDAVEKGLGKNNVDIDVQIAAGDPATCATIANTFVSKKKALIMANATPALQAAAASTTTIPILGTSITDYATALSLENFDGTIGGNISGTSDLAPLTEQVAVLREVFPSAQKVGLLYCSAEANSIYQINIVKAALEAEGVETMNLSFSDSNDIAAVLNTAVGKVDVIYVPTDNTAASNTEIIDSICRPAGLPVVAGEENVCKTCGTVTLSIDYYAIGKKTGEMAVEILKNNADISKMPVAFDTNPVKKYNPTICTELGITVPSTFVAC